MCQRTANQLWRNLPSYEKYYSPLNVFSHQSRPFILVFLHQTFAKYKNNEGALLWVLSCKYISNSKNGLFRLPQPLFNYFIHTHRILHTSKLLFLELRRKGERGLEWQGAGVTRRVVRQAHTCTSHHHCPQCPCRCLSWAYNDPFTNRTEFVEECLVTFGYNILLLLPTADVMFICCISWSNICLQNVMQRSAIEKCLQCMQSPNTIHNPG